jgi:hypothetical protein
MSESQVGEGRGVKPWPGLTRVGERTRLGSRGPGLYPHGEPRVLWGGRACRSAPPSVAVIACALAALRALLRALLLLRALAALGALLLLLRALAAIGALLLLPFSLSAAVRQCTKRSLATESPFSLAMHAVTRAERTPSAA